MNEVTRKEENPSGASGTQNDGSLLEQLANRIKEVKDLLGTNEKNRFAVIEELIEEARSESAQLKINAVEALGVANHLREENQELQEELVQLKLRDMVDQTQTLNSIAYEYNEDIINAHRKERDELLAALEEQQQQVQYMKEENALLQDKINDIEGMEMRSEGEVTNSRDSTLVGVEDHDQTKGSVNTLHSTTSVRSSPSTYPNVNNLGNPLAIAEALKNGASSDTIVAAAGMLQSYVVIQELLEKEKMSRKQLAEEVMELNEIVNSKTFKPPSAWAERELKYKQEKRQWQEERKAADAEICRLRRQLEEIRNMSGTAALEHRIEILESRLLESEQNLALARATIHEMELASRASEGEFSLSGVRPYRGPRGVEGDVSQAVEKIESSNGTPVRQSPSVSSSSNMLSPTVAGVTTDAQSLKRIADYSRLIELEKENELLKVQLHQFSGGHDVFKTPERVPQKVRRLENELMQLNANKVYLIEELKTLKASIPSHNVHYSQHPEEQGVTVSKSEGDTCNPAEPCNDSSELDENDPRLLDIKRRIQEVEHLLNLINKDERNIYGQLDSLKVGQQASKASKKQVQDEVGYPFVGNSLTPVETKGDVRSETGEEFDEENLEEAKNDVPSLMRAKIELETQYQMVQAHANKVEKKLAKANREKRGMLMLMHDVLLSQETDLLGKFLVFAAKHDGIFDGNSPVDDVRKDDDETELSQQVQDDLKLLKQKLSTMTIGSEEKSKLESATSFAPSLLNKKRISNTSQEDLPVSGDESAAGISNLSGQDDCNVESIDFLKEENRTLMELLVESKVRLAEVEGDFLESKRALRRARDKQKELVEQVLDLQGTKKPIP